MHVHVKCSGAAKNAGVWPSAGKIELRRPTVDRAQALAGLLNEFARGERFPSEEEMAEALRRGLMPHG